MTTTKKPTRAPLNAVTDDEDAPPMRRPAGQTAQPRAQEPSPYGNEVPKDAPRGSSRTMKRRAAKNVRQFNVEMPNDLYLMLGTLKLTRQMREGGHVTLQMLVNEAVQDLIARERAKTLHAE
jgi:hypothetical protein